jgi:hypothetical protein
VRYGLYFSAALLAFSGLIMSASSGHAVTIDSDKRLTLSEFAARTGQPSELFETRYAATGMIVCEGVYSTAQLTVRNDVVTTAAHAFFDENGKTRGDLDACVFTVSVEGRPMKVPLDVASMKVGSRNPYAESPVFDWAVVRLAQPVPAARPYHIGPSASLGMPIVLLAHRHRGWVHDGRKAIETCAIRDAHVDDGASPREIAIDCSAGEGASGSAIMTPDDSTSMVGIYVGWRSTHPDTAGPYAPTHMNFGVAVEGTFRSAILAMTQPRIELGAPATASMVSLR